MIIKLLVARQHSKHCTCCYHKEIGYRYKLERIKMRVEDRKGITKYLPVVEHSGNIPDNSVHCIVKTQ